MLHFERLLEKIWQVNTLIVKYEDTWRLRCLKHCCQKIQTNIIILLKKKISLHPVIYEGKKLFSPRVRSVCEECVCEECVWGCERRVCPITNWKVCLPRFLGLCFSTSVIMSFSSKFESSCTGFDPVIYLVCVQTQKRAVIESGSFWVQARVFDWTPSLRSITSDPAGTSPGSSSNQPPE